MIRVLHVMDTLYQKSGIANVVMNYYRNIDRKIIQFDFLITDSDEHTYVSEVESYGGNVYYMPRLGIKNVVGFNKYLNEFFRENSHRYVAIHSHFNQIDFILFSIAKKYGIKELISHSHTTKYGTSLRKSIRNFIMCLPIKKISTKYIACSNEAGVFLFGDKFLNNDKSMILNNAIECDLFKYNYEVRNYLREKYNLQNKFIIGHIGRFNAEKNHKFLIRVFKEINKEYNESILVLVGDGPLAADINKEIIENKLEKNVILLGERQDINRIIQMFDVLIFPSLFEGLGIVLIEAQASGLPCVYSDRIPEVVNILKSNEICSLNDDYKVWANSALKYNGYERIVDSYIKIKESGFDIKTEANKLMNFYISLYNSEEIE